MAEGDEQMRALLVKGSKGQPRANPLIEVARTAARDMVRFAAEFGFSPAARSRISAGIRLVKTPSKFDGLIGGVETAVRSRSGLNLARPASRVSGGPLPGGQGSKLLIRNR
jgi:hypothetical protein